MKNSCSPIHRLAPITALLLATIIAHAATFTSDTVIGINNTNFDGQDIAVTNCTLTIDGRHAFLSVNLLNGAVLSHSSSTNGLLENRLSATGELQILSSTNSAILNAVAIFTNSILVTNPAGGIYQAGTDYGVIASNNFTYLTWLSSSTIPDGATISVSYDFLGSPIAPGSTPICRSGAAWIRPGWICSRRRSGRLPAATSRQISSTPGASSRVRR